MYSLWYRNSWRNGAKFKEDFLNIAKSEKEYFEEILFGVEVAKTQDELEEIESLVKEKKFKKSLSKIAFLP